MEPGTGGDFLTGLLPLLLLSIPFAIGYALVAQRLGKPVWLWVVLGLVPIVNFFFFTYAFFVVVLFIIDRLNELSRKVT